RSCSTQCQNVFLCNFAGHDFRLPQLAFALGRAAGQQVPTIGLVALDLARGCDSHPLLDALVGLLSRHFCCPHYRLLRRKRGYHERNNNCRGFSCFRSGGNRAVWIKISAPAWLSWFCPPSTAAFPPWRHRPASPAWPT